jgi:PhnB protein
MRLNAHLSFNGRCEAALNFYEKCLGGRILMMMRFEDAPVGGTAPAGWGKKVVHATLALDDQVLTGADVPPDRYQKPQGFTVLLKLTDAAEAQRIFEALAQNSELHMPLQETFWSRHFGMLVDQFGVPWMISCGKADSVVPERREGVDERS